MANTQGKASNDWQIVSSPGNARNQLAAVVAVSASNIWAVGLFQNAGEPERTLVEHWNGTAWSVVPSPNASTNYNSLAGVAALYANDIWAVGFSTSDAGIPQTLIGHWNGTTWSVEDRHGHQDYVAAYYLAKWGNDVAKDDRGNVIPNCSSSTLPPTPIPPPGSTLWGVDTTSPITSAFLSSIKANYGTPDFMGRYLDQETGFTTGLTKSEVSYIHGQGIKILCHISGEYQVNSCIGGQRVRGLHI